MEIINKLPDEDLGEEVWKAVVIRNDDPEFEKGINDRYLVSDIGRIKNLENNISVSTHDRVSLDFNGKTKKFLRKRLCLMSFYPEEIPKNLNEWNAVFIDCDKNNLRIDNLRWVTKGKSAKHTFERWFSL
jgi:hypothetical protein